MWDLHQRLEFEERVGIMRFDGELDRDEAERRARRIIDGVDDDGLQFFAEMQRMFGGR